MATIAQEMAIIVRAETEQAKKAFEDLDKTMKALQIQANAASGGGGSLVRTNQALYTSGMGASRGLGTLTTSVAALASAGVVLGQVFRQALRDAEDERAGRPGAAMRSPPDRSTPWHRRSRTTPTSTSRP